MCVVSPFFSRSSYFIFYCFSFKSSLPATLRYTVLYLSAFFLESLSFLLTDVLSLPFLHIFPYLSLSCVGCYSPFSLSTGILGYCLISFCLFFLQIPFLAYCFFSLLCLHRFLYFPPTDNGTPCQYLLSFSHLCEQISRPDLFSTTGYCSISLPPDIFPAQVYTATM